MSETKKGLPRSARLMVYAVAMGAVAVIGLRMAQVGAWTVKDVAAFVGLAAAIAVAEQFLIPLRHRTETLNFSVTDAIWTSALVLTRPSVLTLAVAAGTLVGQGIQKWDGHKLAFNVGQYVLSITAAALVYNSFNPQGVVEPRTIIGATLGMAAFFVVNACTTARVIAFVTERPFVSVISPTLGLNILHWAGNLAVGILAAVVYTVTPWAVPLVAVPLMLSYFAYRGWLRGIQERDRMRDLYEAGRALVGPLDAFADFSSFLVPVQRMLDATAVELVTVEGYQVTVHDSEGTYSLTTAGSENGSHAGNGTRAPQAYVRVRDGLSPQIARMGEAGESHSVLAIYREKPLSPAEQSLLDALASQVSVRLQNFRLFSETVEQRTQLAEVFAHTSDGIFVVSPERRIVSWNPAMEGITGVASEQAVGRMWEDLFDAEGVGSEGLWAPSEDTPNPGEGRSLGVVRNNGVRRWVSYTRNPIHDREGGLKAHVIVARDVTADLEAEQLKADFVATVSHELRTPLTPLKGFLSALLQGTVEDSPKAREEYYRIMLNQASRLERLITDLLEVSRLESGDQAVDTQPVELTSLVAEQVGEFVHHEPSRMIRFAASEIPILAHADPFRVGQVVANLIANAIKYSPAGSPIDVNVAIQDGKAVVSVRDEGDGIPLPEQTRVFERFHRVENGLTRRTGGTGLGLYIAKRLIEAMSGKIWVDSLPGHGSTFLFNLPLAGRSAPVPSLEELGLPESVR